MDIENKDYEPNDADKKAFNEIYGLVEKINEFYKKYPKVKKLPFSTLHNLQFEQKIKSKYKGEIEYRVGTVIGIYHSTKLSYNIVAVTNTEPGNGHFEDLLQWFERSCKRDNKNLVFMHVNNMQFREHLLTKRGFLMMPGTNHCIKIIN